MKNFLHKQVEDDDDSGKPVTYTLTSGSLKLDLKVIKVKPMLLEFFDHAKCHHGSKFWGWGDRSLCGGGGQPMGGGGPQYLKILLKCARLIVETFCKPE